MNLPSMIGEFADVHASIVSEISRRPFQVVAIRLSEMSYQEFFFGFDGHMNGQREEENPQYTKAL